MRQVPLQHEDEHDRELAENVHPEGWTNPEPAACYNLVVIGAGTAGLVTASGAAGLGARVALIERELFGGDCLNTGCVPSKAVIRTGRAITALKDAEEFGASCTGMRIDFGKAMARMRRLRAGISVHDSVKRFSGELGVDVFLGEGKFTGRNSIDIGGKRLLFKKAAVCTGSRPAVPPIPGIREAGYLTNETVFRITQLPVRLAVIGAGPVGCELSQAFSRMGSTVTLIQRGRRILSRDDPDAADIVRRSLERDRVTILSESTVQHAGRRGKEKILSVLTGGGTIELAVDEILLAAGRTPNIAHLDLGAAGVLSDQQQRIVVDEYLRTDNPNIFAAGDVCSPYLFTHVADAMARMVIENALFLPRQKVSKLVIPWCTYTDPELAHVGMYRQGPGGRSDTETLTVPLGQVDRAVLDGEAEGFAKVHLRKGSDRIIGATIVARHAGEMISEITLAMANGMGLSSIGRTVHPYPTQAEAIRKLADQYNRTRLTPFLKKIAMIWFRWRRGDQ